MRAIAVGVDVVTGAFGYQHTDLALPGVAGLSFSRAYYSAAVTDTITNGVTSGSPLGPKWTHSWQYSVWFPSGSTIALKLPGGHTYSFLSAAGVYGGQAGSDGYFTQDTGTHYTLTTMWKCCGHGRRA